MRAAPNGYTVSEKRLASGAAVEFTTRDASGAVVSTVVLPEYKANLLRAARKAAQRA